MTGARIGIAVLAAALLAACAASPSKTADFAAARMALDGHIRELSDPRYEGRAPGTAGGRLAEQYIVDALAAHGFAPGARDLEGKPSWRQPVKIERFTPAAASLTLAGRGKPSVSADNELVVRMRAPERKLENAGVLFVAGSQGLHPGSLSAQVALVRADDLQALGSTLIEAEPALIVALFEEQERFEGFARGFLRGQYALADGEGEKTAFALLGPGASARVFERLNATPQQMVDRVKTNEGPLPLELVAMFDARQNREMIDSANVIGVLRGKVRGSGVVMLLAHWDHLGICGEEGATDRLCNGAVDNASGVGVMLEAARRIAADGPLDRDLYVVGTTAEEIGLLGAEAFAEDPPFPLPTIVAAFNMDTMAISPRGAPITVIGHGRTPLDNGIRTVAETLGRKLDIREEHQQFVARQDGWALLSRDVPAVLVGSAMGDEDAFAAFMSTHYHAASDEWSEDIELGGATEDIFLHVALLRWFGDEATYAPGRE